MIESREGMTHQRLREESSNYVPCQPLAPLGENINYPLITCHLASPGYHGNWWRLGDQGEYTRGRHSITVKQWQYSKITAGRGWWCKFLAMFEISIRSWLVPPQHTQIADQQYIWIASDHSCILVRRQSFYGIVWANFLPNASSSVNGAWALDVALV